VSDGIRKVKGIRKRLRRPRGQRGWLKVEYERCFEGISNG
jgi:hypothetical protein